MKRRNISMALVIIMLLNIFQINLFPTDAASLYMKWNKNDTLDSALQLVQNKAGDNDALLELQMQTVGNYTLEYYLEDSRRTTVTFKQQYDRLVIGYKVDEMIDPVAQTTDNITQDLIDLSFLEMDYTLTIPDWEFISNKTVNADGELEYTIFKSAGSLYPGVAFEINGKKVIIRWDFQTNKLYYLITAYNEGTILPVSYTNPSGNTDLIKILKGLEDFRVKPTHLIYDSVSGENIEISPISNPGDEKPGARPGMEISFKQPKELDIDDWVYYSADDLSNLKGIMEIEGVGSSVYTDINFDLNNADGLTDRTISELPTNNDPDVSYVYDDVSDTYIINIVKDKSELAHQDEIIQWDELEASKIYNINIVLQKSLGFTDYEFTTYLPESKFGYTYMEYELKRANMSEAYLDIKPFDVGSQDEVEYTVLYSKEVKPDLDPDDDLWVRHYYSSGTTAGNIFIPVPFRSDSSQDLYQIIVDFAGVDLKSQVLNYRAKDDLNIPPTTPRIEEVERLYVVPSDSDADTLPMKAQFDLIWTAPDNKVSMELDTIFADDPLGENRIYYELMVNDVPTDTESNPFSVIKVFEVFKDIDGYKLAVHPVSQLTDPDMVPASTINYTEGYNSIEQLFKMETISLYDENGWASVLTIEADEDANTYDITDTNLEYDFEYPGVNYIRVRAVTRIDDKIGIGYPSIPYSLSLSPTAYNVPIPEELVYTPVVTDEEDTVGIDLDWHTVDIEQYVEAMLEPVDRDLDGLYYGVYISEDSNKIKDLEIPEADTLEEPLDSTIYENVPILIPRADLTELDVVLSEEELQLLRDKEIIYFDVETENPLNLNTTLTSRIEGLDKNTNYYIRIVTKAEVSGSSYAKVKMSTPSTMLSITTPSVPIPPDDSEVKPLSVEDLEVTFADDSLLSGKVSWSYPDEITLAMDEYAFEIISIEDKALPDDLNGLMLEDLILEESLEDDYLEYWRVIVEEVDGDEVPVLRKYNEDTELWEVVQPQTLLEIGDQSVSITDDSNTPNRVYYYYVRTINIKGLNIMSASPWQMDTLTTIPVKGPINLIPSYDSGYSYEGKNESIIRFDAPIPDDATFNTADPDYNMEIYVKGEEDADYTMTKYPAEFLVEGDNAPTGYRRFYYRITELKPGKAYNVKVRIEDRTIDMEILPDGTMAYPKSAYSERIIIRTEFDQGEYDKEVKFKEYLEYFDLKVKDLESGPYLVLEKTKTKNIIKYRDSYSEGELLRNGNGTYTIFTEDLKTNIIYLPAKFIETANSKNITLMIQPNEHSLSIRPYAVGKGITTAINDKVEEIRKVNSDLLDYYVKVTIECSTQSGTILSKKPASTVVDIKVEVIGSTALEEDIDDLMIKELKSVISFRREALKEALAEQLLIGLDEKKMLSITQDAVESVKENYQFGANLLLVDRLENNAKEVVSLAKNMSVGLKPKSSDFGLQIYKKSGSSWTKLQSNYYAARYTVETMELTSYVLLPYEASGLSITGTYTNTELDIINKYGLYEVFNSSELSNPSTNLPKYRMLSAYGKILGMASGDNEVQYLKDKGISITTTNMYTDLTRAEVLYVYTQVFAAKNNIKLNNIYITDYNIIQDIAKINTTYRNTLLIGANMNMFKLINGMLIPDNKVTIKEFIELLTRIETGLN